MDDLALEFNNLLERKSNLSFVISQEEIERSRRIRYFFYISLYFYYLFII